MHNCKPSVASVEKEVKLTAFHCPKNQLEIEQMKNIPYGSAVGTLMYVQMCTLSYIAFVVGLLGRY